MSLDIIAHSQIYIVDSRGMAHCGV